MSRSSYTLYLARVFEADYLEYLTENAQANVGSQGHQLIEVDNFGENAHLHVFRGTSGPPPWMTKLSRRLPEIDLFNRQSAAAILFFQVNQSVLAITFAHGWMLLDDRKFEPDFGLRVAINALDTAKLKRLERSNLGDAMQGVAQSPFQRDFQSFGIDDALDLVRKLSGSSHENNGLDTLTGSTSLKLTGEYDLDDIPPLIPEILTLFQSTDYQNTVFSVLDFVRPMADRVLRETLFQLAVDSIKNREDYFELGLPSTVEAEGVSFSFQGPGLRRRFPDLLLRHYQDAMGPRLHQLSTDTLNRHKIVSQFDDDRPRMVWPIQKALVGSISHQGRRYAINDGQWYAIDDGFKNSVEQEFRQTCQAWDIPQPSAIRKIYDENGNGRLEREETYNERIAHELGLVLLDQTMIYIPDVARSGFEPCDLIDVENRRFIHVKKSSRRSNILSHFFKQGSNAAQQMRKVQDTWAQLEDLIRNAGYVAEANQLAANPDLQNDRWSVEFWIADAQRSAGGFNIPFFSKVSLRDEARALRTMQFDVNVRFIEIPPDAVHN